MTFLVLLALAAAGFYVFHVGPVYMGNFDVKEKVGGAFNRFFFDGEDNAKKSLLNQLNDLSTDVQHLEVDEEGNEKWVPGYGVDPDNVTFDYNESTKSLTVRVTYDRVVDFKPLKYRKVFHLTAEKSGTQK